MLLLRETTSDWCGSLAGELSKSFRIMEKSMALEHGQGQRLCGLPNNETPVFRGGELPIGCIIFLRTETLFGVATSIVCMYMSKDYNLKDLTAHVRIERSIVLAVRTGGPGGRFLARTTRDCGRRLTTRSSSSGSASFSKVADQRLMKIPRNTRNQRSLPIASNAECTRGMSREIATEFPDTTRTGDIHSSAQEGCQLRLILADLQCNAGEKRESRL